MSENQDVFDGGGAAVEKNPAINALSILSMIGKGLQSLLWLIAAVFSGTFMNMISGFISDNSDEIMDQMESHGDMPDGMSAEQVEQGMDMFMNMGTGILVGGAVIMLILNILSLMGAARMQKMKRSGFILYIITNSICTLLMLFLFWPIAILQIVFIVLFSVNAKHLKA